MTSNQSQNTILSTIFEAFHAVEPDTMKNLVEILLNSLMKQERAAALQAEPYERSSQRQGYANGFKNKSLNSRVGKLELEVPQTRGVSFYPSSEREVIACPFFP